MAKRTRKINLNWHLLTHDCPECGSRMRIHPNSTTHNICDDCCDVYEVKRDGSLSFYGTSDGSSRSRPRLRGQLRKSSRDHVAPRQKVKKKVKKKRRETPLTPQVISNPTYKMAISNGDYKLAAEIRDRINNSCSAYDAPYKEPEIHPIEEEVFDYEN